VTVALDRVLCPAGRPLFEPRQLDSLERSQAHFELPQHLRRDE
jgi:hypothetical protein